MLRAECRELRARLISHLRGNPKGRELDMIQIRDFTDLRYSELLTHSHL